MAAVLQYLVKRKGLGFNEYGLVDARAAKRQRLVADGAAEAQPAGNRYACTSSTVIPSNLCILDSV